MNPMAAGTASQAAMSRVPWYSCSSMKRDGPGVSLCQPQLTTNGSSSGCLSGRACRNAEPLGAIIHLWQLPA